MTELENATEYVMACRATRQARRTTDPRFCATVENTVEAAGRTHRLGSYSYRCTGCGKTSRNGGSFGFHIRACAALDVHDVALIPVPGAPATEAPLPFGPKYQERTNYGSGIHGDECIICGRRTYGQKNTLNGIVIDGGNRFALLDSPEARDIYDPGYMGCFPVGSECAKTFPAGYLSKGI